MKKYIIILFALLGISSYAFADLGGFTIEGFHVDMNIHSDGSMDIKETIDTNFTEERHGIYREVPIKDAAGDYIQIKDLTTVGDPVADMTIDNKNYTLKIGSARSTVLGPKQYIITYTVENAIKAYASGSNTVSGGRQELYWNVIGPQRDTTIANSTFTITLPQNYTFQSGASFIVRGANGEKNTVGTILQQTTPTTIEGGLTQQLQPKQGITVGLQFPTDYFIARSDYNKLFETRPSLGFLQAIKSGGKAFIARLLHVGEASIPIAFWFAFAVGISALSRPRGSITGHKPAWKSSKAITPYYLPPRNIEPAKAFWFWYNAKNAQVFISMLYYWATKGRIHISLKEGKTYFFGIKGQSTYHIIENIEAPKDATDTDKALLEEFFGPPDAIKDDIALTENSYSKLTGVLGELQGIMDGENILYEKKGNIFTRKFVLTQEGEKLFEEMRGFKEYLDKVEKPVIEKELQNNPDFFNIILPWAVLFGVETKILKICEELLQKVDWYDSYNGHPLNSASFYSMTSGIKSSVIAPRSSGGSGGSGFSSGGGGGFSGGGGGGGGGGSR